MKRLTKIIFSLVLVILFLVTCLFATFLLFVGAWLHTYNVLTAQVLVATVTISPIKSDADGEYMDVTYTPYQQQSALVYLFANDSGTSVQGQTQQFKIYGDTIHVGGPMVKFYDHLILLNFHTIYKIGKIYGRYNADNDLELNRTVQSSFDLNGGVDDFWWTLSDNQKTWPTTMFVHTVEFADKGVFGTRTGGERKFNLYMRDTGLLWEQVN